MNAWRRNMHKKDAGEARTTNYLDVGVPNTYIPPAHEHNLEDDMSVTEYFNEDAPAAEVLSVEREDHREITRRQNYWRNRVNRLLRSCELNSSSWWVRHAELNGSRITEARDAQMALNPFLGVCWNFLLPFDQWSEDRWYTFRQDVNLYMETVQDRGEIAAGNTTSRRRRRRQ